MKMAGTIAVIGALDTKGQDFAFLKSEIQRRGCATLVIDIGVLGVPPFPADITREQVAQAGGQSLTELVTGGDRGIAMTVMGTGASVILRQLHHAGRIQGVISMGGGGGTSVATTAMRALPVGFPKLMVSTLASGDTSGFVGQTDITMMPSIIDVNGVNRITRQIYANAAGAICGMVADSGAVSTDQQRDKPLIAATMFGNTTRAVNHAKSLLEAAGYEVLVFHATGMGGRAMESLVKEDWFAGVLDMTTTEWADELCGGVLSAGSERLDAAAIAGIPQVVVPGCIDMCNFWARDTVPERYRDRLFYEWNPNITLMRTTPEETAQLGEIFATKLNRATAGVSVYVPMKGVSEIDVEGKPFHSPEALHSFVSSLKANLRSDIPVIVVEMDINDPAFAETVSQALLKMLEPLGMH
jgi:uncharacterized protein (UPF0261 family)